MAKDEIWEAIYQLFHLLNPDRKVAESEVQLYFATNPIVFKVLGFDDAASFEKSSLHKLPYDEEHETQREPDFICVNRDLRIATVFELKTPNVTQFITSRSDGQRAKLRAELESYISQTTEYISFISSSVEARKTLCTIFGIDSVLQTKGILLCGLSNEEELANASKIVSRRYQGLELLFFDKLFLKLIEIYRTGRPDIFIPDEKQSFPKLHGLTFCHHFVIPQKQKHSRAYLSELGDTANNRVSIFLENDFLVIEVVDDSGKSHFSEYCPAKNCPTFMRLEVSDDPSARFLSIFIDNKEVEFKSSKQGAEFRPNLKAFTLGADRFGKNGAQFHMLALYFVDRTMNVIERIGSFDYFRKQTLGSAIDCLEFSGSQHMVRNQSGNLVAPDDDRRPIFRKDWKFASS